MTDVDYNHEILPTMSHSQAFNSTYWRLARALGLIDEGEETIDIDPEGILLEVEERLWRLDDLDR